MIVDHATAAAAVGGTANDADPNFRRIVFAANQSVCSDCRRTFERLGLDSNSNRLTRVEYPRGYGSDMVWLKEDPVRSIVEVRVDRYGAFDEGTILDPSAYVLTPGGGHVPATIRLATPCLSWSLRYFPEGVRVVQVTYDGGYDPRNEQQVPTELEMPDDIRDEVIRRIARRWSRGTAEVMKSETMGAYSYTRMDSADEDERRVIRKYRR
jgi:hypothetical protein